MQLTLPRQHHHEAAGVGERQQTGRTFFSFFSFVGAAFLGLASFFSTLPLGDLRTFSFVALAIVVGDELGRVGTCTLYQGQI